MSTPPRDFRQWMRSIERKTQQAIRSGNAGALTALNIEAGKLRDEIAESGADNRTPAAPIELAVQTALTTNANGETIARFILNFPQVTKATDGTDLSVGHYELWGREETNWDGTAETEPTYQKIHEKSGGYFNSGPYDPGSIWRFRVRAIGFSTVLPGEWSNEMRVEMGVDLTAPPIPSPLVVSQNLGVVIAESDGLAANGGGMPADFHHTEIALSTNSVPDETDLTGHEFTGPGTALFVGLAKDTPYYVTSRSVDWSGNKSSWSQVQTITVEWLVTGDISGLDTTIEKQLERTEAAEDKAIKSAQDAVRAQERAEDAIQAAEAAQSDADDIATETAEVAAEAARLEALAEAARAAADQSTLEAEQARLAAVAARDNSKDSFQELHEFMAGEGGIFHQETAPAGEEAHDGNFWIKDSTGEGFVYNNSTSQWVLTDDPVLLAAAQEADDAADAAVVAEQAAIDAQNLAQTRQQEAIAAEVNARAKERAAGVAEENSRTSESFAITAEGEAVEADQHITFTNTALNDIWTTGPIADASNAPLDTTALWIDDLNNAMVFIDSEPDDELPGEWVISPDQAVRDAVRNYTTALAHANEESAEATQARADADAAAIAATDARTEATSARTAATNAQATADQAQLDAQQAVTDARAARTHATRSLQDIQAFAGTSGGTVYQELAPEQPPINMLWIVPSTGISYVWDGNQWREVVNSAVAAAAQQADLAADQARAAEAAAERASASASRATASAENAATTAGGLRGLATTLDASADQAEADATASENAATLAEQEAATELSELDAMIPGVAYHGDTAPSSVDPDDIWVDGTTGQAKVYDSIQAAWVPTGDPGLLAKGREVDAAYDHAAAVRTTATLLRQEATEARTASNTADTNADAAEANAAQLQTAAETAQANADALAQTAATERSEATQALRDVSGTIPDTGEVLLQDATPPAAFRSPDNLWIKKADGTAWRWSGSAWVAETEPEIIAAAEQAALTQRNAEAAQAAAEAEAAEAATAREEAAAAGQTAGGAGEAAAAAQARANEAQAEADAAKMEAQIASTDAASAWKDANSAANSAGSASAQAILAEENAENAQLAAEEAQRIADEEVALVEQRAISRGTDLVTNGTGLLANNYNFSRFTYDPSDAPAGASGSFVFESTSRSSALSDETIAVSTDKVYLMSVSARERIAAAAGSRTYVGLQPEDDQGRRIVPQMYAHDGASETTLTAAVNPGDTTVQVTAIVGDWAGSAYVGFWNWQDESGKVWPVGTYTRNYSSRIASITGTTITLQQPWDGPTIPVGNPVTRNSSGGGYMYTAAADNLTTQWTRYTRGLIGPGVHDGSTQQSATFNFPYGTAQARMIFLINYEYEPLSEQAFALISFSDATAAYEKARTAQERADEAWEEAEAAHTQAGSAEKTATAALNSAVHTSKNLFSADPPSGTAPLNTTWSQYDVNGVIINVWQQTEGTAPSVDAEGNAVPGVDGANWQKRPVGSEAIDNLDVGKLSGAFIDSIHINTESLTIGGSPDVTLGDKILDINNTKQTVGNVTNIEGNLLASKVAGELATGNIPTLDQSKIKNLATDLGTLSKSASSAMVASAYTPNPSFDDWTGTVPERWAPWGADQPTKDTTNTRIGPWSVRFETAGLVQEGMNANGVFYQMPNLEYITVEVEFMLLAGSSVAGAGVLVDWANTSSYRNTVDLAKHLPNPQLNKWYRVTETLRRPAPAPTGDQAISGFLMANYSGLTGFSDKTIVFDWFNARPATDQEVEARKALDGLTQVTNAAGNIDATKIAGVLQTGNVPELNQSKITGLPADLAAKLAKVGITGVNNAKTYNSVLQWNNNQRDTPAPIIIDTPIVINNHMCRVHIAGYNYDDGASEIDAVVSFYATTNATGPFFNASATSTGSFPVGVRLLRKVATDTVSIELTPQAGAIYFRYPQISIPEAIIGYVTPPTEWHAGWSARSAPPMAEYDSGMTPLGRDLNETHQRTNSWTATNKTFIDGGKIFTDSIEAGSIKVNTVWAEIMEVGYLNGIVITGTLLQTDESPTVGVKFTSSGIKGYHGGKLTTDINGVSNLLTGEIRTSPPGAPGIRMVNDSNYGNAAIFFTADGSIDGNQAAVWLDNEGNGIQIRGQHYDIWDSNQGTAGDSYGPVTLLGSGLTLNQIGSTSSVTINSGPHPLVIYSQETKYLNGGPTRIGGNLNAYGTNIVFDPTDKFTVFSGGWEKLAIGPNLVSGRIEQNTYSASGNVVVTSFGTLGRSTSLEASKIAIDRTWDTKDEWRKIKKLRPVTYYDKKLAEVYADYLNTAPSVMGPYERIEDLEYPVRQLGFIAEDVYAGMPLLNTYGDSGDIQGVAYERVSAAQQLWLLEIDGRLDSNDDRLTKLEKENRELRKLVETR